MNITFHDININITCKSDDIKTVVQSVIDPIRLMDQKDNKKEPVPQKEVGVAHRPSAKDLHLSKRPQKEKEADEEVKKTLDNIPELKKAKEDLEKEKKFLAEKKAHDTYVAQNSGEGIV